MGIDPYKLSGKLEVEKHIVYSIDEGLQLLPTLKAKIIFLWLYIYSPVHKWC